MIGDLDSALDTLHKVMRRAIDARDRKFEGITLNNISQVYDARGDYDQAMKYLEESLAIQREVGDRDGEGTTLNNIAAIYYAWGDYARVKYLEESLAIQREIGHWCSGGATLNNIAEIYHARGDYDQALKYLGSWRSGAKSAIGPAKEPRSITFHRFITHGGTTTRR